MDGLPATRVEEIAALFVEDIRERGLRPGDRYLTAAEASEHFSVNPMTAHRAMQSLAVRELLVRQRSRGTFVGPKFRATDHQRQEIDVLHLVMAMDYKIAQIFSSDELVAEFTKSLPDVSVPVHHLLDRAVKQYVSRLLDRIGDSRREGMVLIRCSRDVQRAVADSGVPAVVFGQAYPEVRLACVKHDQTKVGRLMAQYAIDQGAQRFMLLTHARWRHGDHLMFDSAMRTLAEAGVGLDALKIRSLVPERTAIQEIVQEVLEGPEPPEAFLCRSDSYAEIVRDVTKSLPSDGCHRPCVVSGGHSPADSKEPFARVVSTLTLAGEVEQIVKLLVEVINDPGGEPGATIVDVRFCDHS